MKVRDSGMPEEEVWSEFFDPHTILRQMQLTTGLKNVVDLGSGYGTFSIPAAEGDCIIGFGFSSYLPKRLSNVEFVADIKKIQLKPEYNTPLTPVRTALLNEFDKMKTEKYEMNKAKYFKN